MPYLWYDLPLELAASVPALLAGVHRRVAAVAPEGRRAHLPFQMWADVCAAAGGAVPGRWRTYRGLVLADKQELEVLGKMNENAGQDWAAILDAEEDRRRREGSTCQPRALETPTFFLTVLDLSGDVSFTNNDVHHIKAVAPALVVLQLDGTLLTDEGL